MDGEVIIDINADESKFDKKMDKLEQKLKNEKLDLEIKTGNVEDAKRELHEISQELEKVKKKRDELNKTFESKKSQYETLNQRINNGESLTPDEYYRYGSLENTIDKLKSQVNQVNAEFEKQNNLMNKAVDNVTKTEMQYEKQKSKVIETTKEVQKLNQEMKKSQLTGIKDVIQNIGKNTEGTIKKVGRWALALLGIRSAYMLIRRAASTISQYDDQVKADLQYIQVALASILEPVIKRIISLVYTLLQYLQIIIYQWTGKNIFANANKALNKMTGSAKELKKQLAGFDEMNVLSDSSSSGGGGAIAPSMDLSKIQGNVPEWLDWIVRNKDLILAVIGGITAALIALKVLGLDPIMSLGIGLIIGGVIYAIQALIDYLKDPSFENFGKIIEGIGIAVIGLGVAFFGWPVALAGAIVLLIGVLTKYWEDIKRFFSEKVFTWLDSKRDWIEKKFGKFGLAIYDTLTNAIKLILNVFDVQINALKRIFDGLIQFITGIFTGNWKKAWEGIKNIFGGIWDNIKGTFSAVLGFINSMVVNVASATASVISSVFKKVVNAVLGTIESVLNTPIKTINSLIKTVNKVPGINLEKLSTFNLPRLAKGTILNAPGKGVPVAGGSATAGEAGREAYLPLSDAQLLEELGSTIGKYININATIPVYMGNRQVVREFRKISAEDDFAYNR